MVVAPRAAPPVATTNCRHPDRDGAAGGDGLVDAVVAMEVTVSWTVDPWAMAEETSDVTEMLVAPALAVLATVNISPRRRWCCRR